MSKKKQLRKLMKDCGINDRESAERVLQARNVLCDAGFNIHKNVVQKTVEEKREEIKHEVVSLVLAHNMAMLLDILHTKYGFGAKRLRDFLSHYFNYSEVMINPDKFGVETPDICRTLLEECDFDIQKEIREYDKQEKLTQKHDQRMYDAFTHIATTNMNIRQAFDYCVDGKNIRRDSWRKRYIRIEDDHIVDNNGKRYQLTIEDIGSYDWSVAS